MTMDRNKLKAMVAELAKDIVSGKATALVRI
jgi:hypothetical protein